jgi:hypothetical protein
MRNLRQNSVQGVRTRDDADVSAGCGVCNGASCAVERLSAGGVLMAGSLACYLKRMVGLMKPYSTSTTRLMSMNSSENSSTSAWITG